MTAREPAVRLPDLDTAVLVRDALAAWIVGHAIAGLHEEYGERHPYQGRLPAGEMVERAEDLLRLARAHHEAQRAVDAHDTEGVHP